MGADCPEGQVGPGLPTAYVLKSGKIRQRLTRGNAIVNHRGVEYTVAVSRPDVWQWQFQIGDKVINGKTEAKLKLLAIRRVQARIDRELNKIKSE